MRIVSVSTDYPGPRNARQGLFVHRRLAAIARLAEVRVIHPEPWFPWLRPIGPSVQPACEWEEPPASHLRMFYLPGILKNLDSHWVKRVVVPQVRAWERANGSVDLIDAHFGYPEGVGCVRAGLSLNRPVFITMRGLERPVLTYRDRRTQLLWALRKCAGIISVAEALKDLAVSVGIDPEKIRVIPNAVDRNLFRVGDQAEARRVLDVSPGPYIVVCVGMLIEGKGQHILIEAISRLKERVPELRLVLIGGMAHESSYPRRLDRQVNDLGLADVVQIIGPQPPERVVTWLQAADLFALPTFDEGCCNAVLEAMACGLPVLTTPAGDNALLVDPPHRGLIVPIQDVGALAQGIETAMQTAWNRSRIAQYGRDHTWDEVARQTLQFFRERLQAARGC